MRERPPGLRGSGAWSLACLVSVPLMGEVASASALGLDTNRPRPAVALRPAWAQGPGTGRNRGSQCVPPVSGSLLLSACAEMTI